MGRPPLRVALLGYGLAGAFLHAPLIASVDDLELAAIVTRDEGRRENARHDHPDAELLDGAEEIWQQAAAFDLAVVATPNEVHVPLARAALEAGLAVVVDKPLAASAAEASLLAEFARQRGLLLTVSQNRRWDGDFLTVRDLLDRGALGRVLRFESRFERWRLEPSGGWRERPEPDQAGGLLYDLGSHLVDQALQLFGPVQRVYAELDVRRAGGRVDDDAFVALEHISTVRSQLWMSALAAQPGPRFRVLGDRAAYVKYGLDIQEEDLRESKNPGASGWGEEPEERWGLLGIGTEARAEPTRRGTYACFYQEVALALRGDGPPPVHVDEVLAGLEILDAARVSAREGRVVELPTYSASRWAASSNFGGATSA